MGSPQKVVIPKGLVNPNETTIVEIPKNLQNVGTVVARPRQASSSTGYRTPSSRPQKRSFMRHTYPPKSKGMGDILHDSGVTWQGRPWEDSSDLTNESPYYDSFDSPQRVYGDISTGDISWAVGQPYKKGFDPQLNSTLRGIDEEFSSPYMRDFRHPKGKSSMIRSPPGYVPPMRSFRKYQDPGSDVSPDSSYLKSSITTSTPEGVTEEQSEEKSYYEYEDSSDFQNESCPCTDSSNSGAYQRFNLSDSPGSFVPPPAQTPRKITQREVMNSLGELETAELSQIMDDLSAFQKARRRLVFDASSLASAGDVSSNLLENAADLSSNLLGSVTV